MITLVEPQTHAHLYAQKEKIVNAGTGEKIIKMTAHSY